MPEDMKVFQDMKILQSVITEAMKKSGGGATINIITVQAVNINFDGTHQTALMPPKTRSAIASEIWRKRKALQAAKEAER